MPDPKSRARVVRLLSGTFRPDDLTGLFLYARDHCDGRETVSDIGHFVAHHHERNKGIITRATRDWFTIARFHLPRFTPGGSNRLEGSRLPSPTRDFLQIAANRLHPRHIRRNTGLSQSEAHKIAVGLSERLQLNPDGTWRSPGNISYQEIRLIEFFSGMIVIRPAFEVSKFVEDFIATLKMNGLITKEEIRSNYEMISSLIQIYAVAAMHNCVVQIGDGTTTQLKTIIIDNKISVVAYVPIPINNKPDLMVSGPIFTAEVDPQTHCHETLLRHAKWNFEIEVTPDKILAPLQSQIS